MKRTGLTDAQLECVECTSGALLISAGAGSGKTFTLTQRIANALLDGEPIADIDEVLAITFTEKAAAEIKARVRGTLYNVGLIEQALKVDAAWISTIHGMCARILRIHALELGIDPGFKIIDDAQRKDLISEAINEVLDQGQLIASSGKYEALFNEFPVRSTFVAQSSIVSMLEALLDKAANLRNGLNSFLLGPKPESALALAKKLQAIYEEVLPALKEGGESALALDALADAQRMISFAREKTYEWAVRGGFSAELEAARIAELALAVDTCVLLTRRFGSKEVKKAVGQWQEEYSHLINEIALALASPAFDDLLELAHEVSNCFEKKKRDTFVFDNNDLLLETLKAFEQSLTLASLYEHRFKLVMVDEFQDTSQVQIDIIEKLAGRNSYKLCTVGDAQQSIYRFRGADVNVYEQHSRRMRSTKVRALSVELTKNFRSHNDILRFVDRIFEQPGVFGRNFMALEADEKRTSTYKAKAPRIDMVLAMMPAGNNSGVDIEDAKKTEAQAIAERFSVMAKAGHNAGDMVLLLGKMTRAEVFAKAFRDVGFECVITGGSLFDKSPEVQVIARFVEVLANPTNTSALFEVLTSDMFGLSADDLIKLSTVQDSETGLPKRCDIYRGYRWLIESIEEGATQVSLRLSNAIAILDKSQRSIGMMPVARIIEEALLDSGWLRRFQDRGARGGAQAGNLFKAIRHLEELEKERYLGVAQLAVEFAKQLDYGIKEPPGALNGAKSGVIKIMSIHASKGLEFPIVALAEFSGVQVSRDKLVVEACDGKAYASLLPSESLDAYPTIKKKLSDFDPYLEGEPACGFDQSMITASDLAMYRAALKEFAHSQNLAEVRRKLYVGLTRASEALIISFSARNASKDPLSAYKDVTEDMRTALCGNDDFPAKIATLEYGGSEPAAFERIAVVAQDAYDEEQKMRGIVPEKETFFVPHYVEYEDMEPSVWRPQREGVYSYTSLSKTDTVPDAKLVLEANESGLKQAAGLIHFMADDDKASNFGNAFHLLAQHALEAFMIPPESQIKKVAALYKLSEKQTARLNTALSGWFKSKLYKKVYDYPITRAELEFFVPLGDFFLEGSIDAFCSDNTGEAGGKALVVDYKTGGSKDETEEALEKKHRLQARCYAYAVLSQGYSEVELKFVRVERGKQGNPQVISYSYTSDKLSSIEREILKAL